MSYLTKISFAFFVFLFGINTGWISIGIALPGSPPLSIDSRQAAPRSSPLTDTEIKHKVYLKHPGVSLTDSIPCTLVQTQPEIEGPDEFYMDVKTVVCGDSQCRMDEVRIFWDALGFYDRLVLPPGVELEKAEGKNFTLADYTKLNSILSNAKSSLREVYKEEVVGSETSEGVDAMSGATIILNTNDYVEGAVWTSYTLWHWVHGGVGTIIRDISGAALSIEELQTWLEEDDIKTKIFAIEQLTKRKSYHTKTVDRVQALAKTEDYVLQKRLITYIEEAPAELYYAIMLSLFSKANQQLRLQCLNALLQTKHTIPEGYYDQFCDQFSSEGSYQEHHLFLSILERKNIKSTKVIKLLLSLLKHDNFLIARRAYWFLQDQQLSLDEQHQLKWFYQTNKDRL